MPGRDSVAIQELVFLASQIQPLGLTTFLLHREEQVELEDNQRLSEYSVNDSKDRSRWSMGKEGGLRLETSTSSSEIRLIDPCRGVDMEVIRRKITYGDIGGNPLFAKLSLPTSKG